MIDKIDIGLEKVLLQCSQSLEKHCVVFHPSRFSRPFSTRHKVLFDAIDDPSIQKLLILAHRGFGKTSIVNFGLPSQAIVHKKFECIVPVSASATLSIMQTENLKRSLLSDLDLKSVVGDIRPQDAETFSKDMWVTANGVMVFPRGREQQIRGTLHGDFRPDLLIGDDLEDPESVLSYDRREKTKEWFFSDFSNCVDRSRDNWKMIVIGTILHEDCLLMNLYNDPSWKVLEFPLWHGEYEPYDPLFMSKSEIEELVAYHERQGLLGLLHREYQNDPAPREDATFKQDYFQYYTEAEVRNDRDLESVVIVDPAKTANPTSADSAIVGVGVNTRQGRIYVRDVIADKLHPDELVNRSFEMATRLGAFVIAVEDTGIEDWIHYPFENEMYRQGKVFQLEWLKARGGNLEEATKTVGGFHKRKARRISLLVPYYRLGQIFHNVTCKSRLEEQLLSFPKSRLWDVMDAFSYIVQLLESGGKFFSGWTVPKAPNAGGERSRREEDFEDEDEELERLLEEDLAWDQEEALM